MEPGRTDSTEPAVVGAAAGAGPSPASWAAWEAYYREASRRRRSQGRGRTLRDEKRKRRLRERLGFLLSALLVAAMTGVFYMVLK